jgi:hypothetical protein
MSSARLPAGVALLVALSGLVLACAAGDGGPAPEVVETPTVESLVARHIEARGGKENLQAIETLRMSGRATHGPGREALVSREVRPPGKIRTEFELQGVTSVYACDGSTCWYVDPLSGVFDAEPMSADETAWAMQEADVFGAIDWQEKGHQLALLGTETIDGREAWEVEVTLSSGPSRLVYVDKESALVVRRVTPRTLGGRAVEVQTDFGDFREVAGVMFPHSIRTGAAGEDGALEVTVETVEVNVPLDDSRFAMPAS